MGLLGCENSGLNADVEVDSTSSVAGKGDCPTCDAAGPAAMVQAGIADRFYARGDRWQVAYQFRERHDMAMEMVLKVPEADLPMGSDVQSNRDTGPLFLFDYEAFALSRQVFPVPGGSEVQREVVSIRVVPGNPEITPFSDLFSSESVTQMETRLEFEMNDLLEPVSETIYTRSHPNGKRIRLAQKSRLQTGSSIFPHTIPRALVQPGYTPGVAIELSPELEAAANAFVPDWRERVYLTYRFNNLGESVGQKDLVYWAEGDLWPFYVQTEDGAGILTRFQETSTVVAAQ